MWNKMSNSGSRVHGAHVSLADLLGPIIGHWFLNSEGFGSMLRVRVDAGRTYSLNCQRGGKRRIKIKGARLVLAHLDVINKL